jgi:hypothetical protein
MSWTSPIQSHEYGPYYKSYVANAQCTDVITALRSERDAMLSLFRPLSEEQMNHTYRPGAWSLKQVIRHVTDTERIFGYRGLCIARGDKGPFPGFDENGYADVAEVEHLDKEQLLFDFVMSRNALVSLFAGMTETELKRVGVASDNPLSVRAIPYILLGHARHHIHIVEERYLDEDYTLS